VAVGQRKNRFRLGEYIEIQRGFSYPPRLDSERRMANHG
jgi:hypothetical protein